MAFSGEGRRIEGGLLTFKKNAFQGGLSFPTFISVFGGASGRGAKYRAYAQT